MYEVEVIEASVGPSTFHKPVYTLKVKLPRILLAEVNTHRVISKNTASSRAIPVKRRVEETLIDPYIPLHWGKNQPGMSADEECNNLVVHPRLDIPLKREDAWNEAMMDAINWAEAFSEAGYHKQIVNRLFETFTSVTAVWTSCKWANLLALRDHPKAQPEFQLIAQNIKKALANSTPKVLQYGEWHLPFVTEEERKYFPLDEQIKLSVARCASTSYNTVDGYEMTPEKVNSLYSKLFPIDEPIHASPAEHQCTPDEFLPNYNFGRGTWSTPEKHGNLTGYIQYRKLLPNEQVSD